jgi:Glycosyl transferases group 1
VVDEYVSRTAAMMTVSRGIADEYRARAGVSPALVTNAPFFQELDPSPVSEPIRLLHVGFADARRRLELTIDAVRSLAGNVTLDLVLTRNPDYRQELQARIANDPHIRILPPVSARDVISFSNAYDVGVHLLPPDYPNMMHALPNKLFDYIQARLAVAIGPSPEMARIVREWDCGVVSDSFTAAAFAEALKGLTVDVVERLKRNSDRAARVLNANSNRETILDLVDRAIASRQASGV